ncbi:hypothetical protein [Luteibacter sp.]|jgi:hypothetical protein|uniref:hypothetical protein n=1 Tax=Luteibacter sp. TaxID=1886636 RepID=UPI002F4187A4
MKTWIFLAAATFAGAATGQSVSYRDNDPFVFCAYGLKNPDRCWWPISAAAGTFMWDPTCNPPNTPYGRPRTPQDYASNAEWLSVCTGVGEGKWEGAGTGEQYPYDH